MYVCVCAYRSSGTCTDHHVVPMTCSSQTNFPSTAMDGCNGWMDGWMLQYVNRGGGGAAVAAQPSPASSSQVM